MPDSFPLSTSLRDRIVGFSEWWTLRHQDQSSLDSKGRETMARLLDLRPSTEYESRRLFCGPDDSKLSLLVVPFPVEHMEERSFELPARHVEFTLLLSESDVDRASSYLLGAKSNARKRLFNPWKIAHVLLDNAELWEEANSMGAVLNGVDEETIFDDNHTQPLPRLWQPDPMVENVLLPLLKERHHLCPSTDDDNLDIAESSFGIWDLASGAGRDAVFLAEELVASKQDYTIFAVDHRYNDKESAIVNDFFRRRGVRRQSECLKLNLSEWHFLEKAILARNKASTIAALYCVRFWKPALIQDLANSQSLPPGVLFGISHFCRPHEGAPWNFEHPSEKSVLERNQLAQLFTQAGWEIIHDKIATDSDHGRTMIHFVARRQ